MLQTAPEADKHPGPIEFRLIKRDQLKIQEQKNRGENSHMKSHSHLCDETKGGIRIQTVSTQRGRGDYNRRRDTVMKLLHVPQYTQFIQTAHKRHRCKYHLDGKPKKKNTQMFRPCFSPSPPPVEVQFILQFIYIYIVSMHKRIARPNRNDRGAVVGSLFSFSSSFFFFFFF